MELKEKQRLGALEDELWACGAEAFDEWGELEELRAKFQGTPKQTAHIENWSFELGGTIHIDHPGRAKFVLHGNVVGHPKLGDMEFIATSEVEVLDLKQNTCTTRNTVYTLGVSSVFNVLKREVRNRDLNKEV